MGNTKGKSIMFNKKLMSSVMDMILKYLCGGNQGVIGKRVLMIRRGASTGL